MTYCSKCGNQTMLMSGTAYLSIDDEPYESGVIEESKTGVIEVEKDIIAHYCEKCGLASTFCNE